MAQPDRNKRSKFCKQLNYSNILKIKFMDRKDSTPDYFEKINVTNAQKISQEHQFITEAVFCPMQHTNTLSFNIFLNIYFKLCKLRIPNLTRNLQLKTYWIMLNKNRFWEYYINKKIRNVTQILPESPQKYTLL